ncbi:MAG TPA: hypothetical protein VMS43_10795 [Allosphingosinicella sp.]|nr:hypothetical protein [Allosphingosinicella sp.]
MRIVKAACLAAMGTIAVAAPAGAQREGAWLGVGTRTLAAGSSSQTFEVRTTVAPREIKFCVDGGDLRLASADVRFRSGDSRAVRLATRVRAGRCTAEYSLRNREAELGSVTVAYDPASLGRATPSLQVLVR